MKKYLCICLFLAAVLTACRPDLKISQTRTVMQQEGIEEKEPGMYFLGGFTSWERLETKGDFWIEDGTLMAHVSEETEVKDNANRIGGTIVLPEGITAIGEYVFAGCQHVEKVVIPRTLQSIGMCAFDRCTQLQVLEIPEGVTRIGRHAFNGVKNVIYSGERIYTPDDVFWGADSLNQEEKSEAKTFVAESEGVRYTYQKFDERENAIVITRIENAGRNLVIPAQLDGFDVFCIGSGEIVLFGYDEKIKKQPEGENFCPVMDSVEIENGIKGVSSSAFEGIYAKRLILPQSLEYIHDAAFYGNRFLEKIDMKCCQAYIGKEAFSGTGIRELQLPAMKDMGKQIRDRAFHNSWQLKRVTFAEGTREVNISRQCFGDCPDVRIMVGRGVKTFSSDININSGIVCLLDKKTEILFSKMVKAKEGTRRGNYVDMEGLDDGAFRYRTSFRKFIVPEGFEQMDKLKNAYYIVPEEEDEPREARKGREFYQDGYEIRKIKCRIEK